MKITYPEHRKEFSDLAWAAHQKKGPPNFYVGDIVEFHVGGFGVINEVSQPHDGWPSSYKTGDVPTLPGQPKRAWHYEGDFKRLVGESPIRRL